MRALKTFVTKEIAVAKKLGPKEESICWQYWFKGYEAAMIQVKFKLDEKPKKKRKTEKGETK